MRINRVRQLISLVALLLLIIIMTCGWVILPAYADNVTYDKYTTALEDLTRDENFNTAKYVDDAGNYSLQVIQIAESADGELFVYTYQPCQKSRYLVATSLNMSLSENVDSTQIYDLSLLNVSGVLCKYLVKGVTVQSADETRYYNITGIYRAWDKDIDDDTGNDNEINEVVYSVGKLYLAVTTDKGVEYRCIIQDVIEIRPEQKYCGYLRYMSGWLPFGYVEKCDSHYVAFDCDYEIEYLFSCDIFYVEQKYQLKQSLFENLIPIGSPNKKSVELKGEDKSGNDIIGLLASKYEWKRIEKVSDFINNSNDFLSEEVKNNLRDKQWVLRFTETLYDKYNQMGAIITDYSSITEVSILRLDFKMNGERYNLGVVDNKQTGGDTPSNKPHYPDFWDWLEYVTGVPAWVWKMLAVIIPLIIALSILSIFVAPVRDILGGVWFVITLPFRGIAALIRKIRGD